MRVGAVVPYWLDRPADEALSVAMAAERCGLAEVWVGEMLSYDAFVLAGAVAQATERIRIVPGPLPVPVRTPVGIAMGIAGLQQLAGPDRVAVALGSSTAAVVEGWHGRSWDDLPERMVDTVEILRTVLGGGRSDHAGIVESRGFRLGIPASVPEIAIAAFGPRMRAVASDVGDRLVLNIVTPDAVRAMAGRSTTVWVTAGLEPSAGALASLRRQLALYLAAPGYGEMLSRAGFGGLVDAAREGKPVADLAAAMPDELPMAVGAIGSADDVRAALGRFETAGADTVALVPMTWDDPAGERLFGMFG
jgi:probable F420-dependent oxidoreductase